MNFLQRIPLRIFNIFYPVKIYGKNNIPKGSAVLVSNHFRIIDCGFVADVYGKDIYFLAKHQAFKNKFVSKIIKSYGGIPINRENPDISSLLSATKVLKQGNKLAIFPEGTRNKTNTTTMLPLKPGMAVFAVKAKCPIVPIMMLNKAKFLRRTKIIVGEPFEFPEFYDKKLTDDNIKYMDNFIRRKMEEEYSKLVSITSKRKAKKDL